MMVVNKMAADSVGEAMFVVHWAGYWQNVNERILPSVALCNYCVKNLTLPSYYRMF